MYQYFTYDWRSISKILRKLLGYLDQRTKMTTRDDNSAEHVLESDSLKSSKKTANITYKISGVTRGAVFD